MKDFSSEVKAYVLRLKPKEDLKKSILAFAEENHILAGSVNTCVGSLEQFHVRFANQQKGKLKKGFFEILSLTRTFSNSPCHLHISVSDQSGNTKGGHLLDDNLIYTNAEIALLEFTDLVVSQELDPTYGFKELVIRNRKTD